MAILTIMYEDKLKSIEVHEFELRKGDIFMSTMEYLFTQLVKPLIEEDAKVFVHVNDKLKLSFFMNKRHHIHGDVIIETEEGTVRKVYKNGCLRKVTTPHGTIKFPKKMVRVSQLVQLTTKC